MLIYKLICFIRETASDIGYWFKHNFSYRFYVNELNEERNRRNREKLIRQIANWDIGREEDVEKDCKIIKFDKEAHNG